MNMVCGLDLHRGQITFDALALESGEVWRGRLWAARPSTVPPVVARGVGAQGRRRSGGGGGGGLHRVALCGGGGNGRRFRGACGRTGRHAGCPGAQEARQDRSQHAKLLRELLQSGDLPESWIPPEAVLEWRERVRLYKTLADQRRMWIQRMHAELFQHGVSVPEAQISSAQTRDWLVGDAVQLSTAARQRVAVGYHMIDATQAVLVPLRAELERFGRRQPACKALAAAHYRIGPLTAVVVWAELGDCRRFSRSMQVVRHTRLDVTVDASDRHRNGGYLSRQGAETLRWALFEAGMSASRATSPDRAYYQAVKAAHDGKLAAISTARKLALRCYHTLRAMDPEVVYAMPS